MKIDTISKLLSDEKKHLDKLHKIVKDSIEAEELVMHNLSQPSTENLNFGERLSDNVAVFGGSWKFIITFFIVLTLWIVFNVLAIGVYKFDTYPFILMNLILSCIALLQAPIIMMSQNRQGGKGQET